jgi:hypothetical protein
MYRVECRRAVVTVGVALLGSLGSETELQAAGSGRTQGAVTRPTVAISEICFWPAKPDEPKWVELYNYGDQPVEVANWSIVDGKDHLFAIPGGMEKLAPKGYLLVKFGGAPGEPDRPGLRKEGPATTHCREAWVSEVFSGQRNECTVYDSATPDAGHLVDYVCWGVNPTSTSEHQERAIKSGRWPDRRGLRLGPPDLRPGDHTDLPTGGSLYRMLTDSPPPPRGGWLTCGPEDITPGQPNHWPAPVPLRPGEGTFASGIRPCLWTLRANPPGNPDDLRCQIQVATDANFGVVVFDKTVQGSTRVTFDLPVGKYFWRIRCLYKETAESQYQPTGWSRVVPFTIQDPRQP